MTEYIKNGQWIKITNPKTFMDGVEGHVINEVRPGLFRIKITSRQYQEVLLLAHEFTTVDPDGHLPPIYD